MNALHFDGETDQSNVSAAQSFFDSSRVVQLDDLDDPRARAYSNPKERTLRGESIFIAEGPLVVERLLKSRFKVESILATKKALDAFDALALAPDDVPVYCVDEREAMNRLVGFEFHQGILATGRRAPLPTLTEGLDAYFAAASRREKDPTGAFSGSRRAWVVLPDATKPDNLGLTFRCAAALDAEAVVLGERCCDPFSRRALRVSMGGALQTPIYRAESLIDEIREAQARWKLPFVATALDRGAQPLADLATCDALRDGAAFLFGNEYYGLSREMIDLCDYKTIIPMRGDVDSLNLGVSVGIVLYEYNRAS